MQRNIFTDEHNAFRDMVSGFLDREIVPHHQQWEKDGIVPREAWTAAGKLGLFGFEVPARFGGGDDRDFRYNAILTEEISSRNLSGLGFSLHNDVVTPYLVALTSEEQKERWLPGVCSGDVITAIAMTEPGTGSDLQSIRTNAVRDGEDWVLNGQKTFITNGINADLIVVVARTDPDAGAHGLSLLVVERGMDGFDRGRNLEKLGMHGQDTAELSFTDVRVPSHNLLGKQDQGFFHLMHNLPAERLSIAVIAVAGARSAIEQTIGYVKERKAFGTTVADFQNTKFVLAECATEVEMAQAYVDKAILLLNEGQLADSDAAMAKWWCSEMQNRIVARCLQLHGGYGYMNEYPIAKAYKDARVTTIYGGTTEIMKEIVARSLFR